MNQELFIQGDKVLYLRYYNCEVIEVFSDSSNVALLYLIETLDTKKRFIAYPNDLQLID